MLFIHFYSAISGGMVKHDAVHLPFRLSTLQITFNNDGDDGRPFQVDKRHRVDGLSVLKGELCKKVTHSMANSVLRRSWLRWRFRSHATVRSRRGDVYGPLNRSKELQTLVVKPQPVGFLLVFAGETQRSSIYWTRKGRDCREWNSGGTVTAAEEMRRRRWFTADRKQSFACAKTNDITVFGFEKTPFDHLQFEIDGFSMRIGQENSIFFSVFCFFVNFLNGNYRQFDEIRQLSATDLEGKQFCRLDNTSGHRQWIAQLLNENRRHSRFV